MCVCLCMCVCMSLCVCVFHLNSSAQLSMADMEKRYRNKIITTTDIMSLAKTDNNAEKCDCRFLRDSLDDRVVKSQDTGTVIASIASTKAGHLFAWHFLQQTWDTLLERYSQCSHRGQGVLSVKPIHTK